MSKEENEKVVSAVLTSISQMFVDPAFVATLCKFVENQTASNAVPINAEVPAEAAPVSDVVTTPETPSDVPAEAPTNADVVTTPETPSDVPEEAPTNADVVTTPEFTETNPPTDIETAKAIEYQRGYTQGIADCEVASGIVRNATT